jgi:hypothetical protein
MSAHGHGSLMLRWLIQTVSIPLLLCVLLFVLLSACTSERGPIGLQLRSSGRFDTEWRAYLKLPPHKSIAFAGDVEGRYVIGYGFEKATTAEAMSAAMEDCNLRRADKRIEDSCRIVAVDDEMIGDLIREE